MMTEYYGKKVRDSGIQILNMQIVFIYTLLGTPIQSNAFHYHSSAATLSER